MYSFLKGTIISKQQNTPFGTFLILNVNNVGYSIMANFKTLNKLPAEGSEVTVYTQLIHREDNMYLCGFITPQERDLFNFLQSVSGVGIKVALRLLGELEPLAIITAVIKQDHKALSKSKGIGPKIAQRIVLELKDKMVNWRPQFEKQPELTTEIELLDSYIEAESIMISLGYSEEEIKESIKIALKNAKDKNDTEQILHEALKFLSI